MSARYTQVAKGHFVETPSDGNSRKNPNAIGIRAYQHLLHHSGKTEVRLQRERPVSELRVARPCLIAIQMKSAPRDKCVRKNLQVAERSITRTESRLHYRSPDRCKADPRSCPQPFEMIEAATRIRTISHLTERKDIQEMRDVPVRFVQVDTISQKISPARPYGSRPDQDSRP